MSAKDVLVWLFARNTKPGSRYLRGGVQGLMAQAALRAFRNYQEQRESDSRWREDGSRGKSLQYEDGDVRVEVVNGYSQDTDEYTTDIKVIHRDSRVTEHLHVIYDEQGKEIMNEWRPNH